MVAFGEEELASTAMLTAGVGDTGDTMKLGNIGNCHALRQVDFFDIQVWKDT